MTSEDEALYCNIKNGKEIDLADQEGVAGIESVLADERDFFVLANKRDSKLGYYLFTVNQADPEGMGANSPKPKSGDKYLINWNNKLDIGNCSMHIMKEKFEKEDGTIEDSEYVVVCYKSIGINTFNVFVIDLKTKLIKYWHESN